MEKYFKHPSTTLPMTDLRNILIVNKISNNRKQISNKHQKQKSNF